MAREISVTDLDLDDPAWIDITENARGASAMHDPRVVRAEALLHGGRVTALGAWRGTELVGGIAVTVCDNTVHPRTIVSYNGPLVADLPDAHPRTRLRHEAAVAEALLHELSRRHHYVHLRMRPGTVDVRGLLEQGWSATVNFTYHVDITDLALAWHRIDQNRRRLVRRATERGLTVHEYGHDDDLDAMAGRIAELHRVQMRHHGQIPVGDPVRWREVLADLLAHRSARLFVTHRADREAVAFVLVSTSSPLAVMLASGSEPSHLDDGATALLRWEMFTSLARDGVTEVDLHGARSGPAGRFKASFGGELAERWDLVAPRRRSWRGIPRHLVEIARDDIRALRENRP